MDSKSEDVQQTLDNIIISTAPYASDKVGFFHALIREFKNVYDNPNNAMHNIVLCKLIIQYLADSDIDIIKEMTTAELVHILQCFSTKESKINIKI